MNLLEDLLNNLMIERIKEYGKREQFGKVIDLGGKDGIYTSRIAKQLTIVDQCPEEIVSEVNYVCSDIFQFNTEEKFDLIVSSAFLEHFTREEGLKILENINKFLKNDGMAFITCPNARSVNRLLGQFLGLGDVLELSEGDKKVGHKYLYDLERLEGLVKERLVYLDSGSYFFKPLPSSDMNNLFDENGLKSFASITSKTHPQLKPYLAEIFVVARKKI